MNVAGRMAGGGEMLYSNKEKGRGKRQLRHNTGKKAKAVRASKINCDLERE